MGGTNTKQDITLKELILNLKNWILYLISKWYILILAVVLGSALGILYTKLKKPIYTATTSFVLEGAEPSNGLGQYAGIASMMGVDLGGGNGGIFQGDNLIELYKSRTMIEAALLKPSQSDSSKVLLDHYFEMEQLKDQWKKKRPELLSVNFALKHQNSNSLQRQRDSVISRVVDDINSKKLAVGKPDKKLSIIKIDVSGTNEIFAKEFNEALVAEVNEFYVKTKTKKSLDNISILQHKTDSVRAAMNGAISSAAVAIDNTPNLNPTKQILRLVPSQRSQFSAETNKTILAQLLQNLELSKLSLMKEAPLIQIIDNPVYPVKENKIGVIKGAVIGAFLLSFITIVILTVINTVRVSMKD
ncbi:MAG: lipopolysaccharide biosynthesis protein [Sphingobacterium sp.]|jgi:hypothetical protein|nr:lipopolysaccharide biosynthesis protein [Sphingobacterium sp.]